MMLPLSGAQLLLPLIPTCARNYKSLKQPLQNLEGCVNAAEGLLTPAWCKHSDRGSAFISSDTLEWRTVRTKLCTQGQ